MKLFGVRMGDWIEIREAESRPKVVISRAKTTLGVFSASGRGWNRRFRLVERKEKFITMKSYKGGTPIGVIKRRSINPMWFAEPFSKNKRAAQVIEVKEPTRLLDTIKNHGFEYAE